MGRRALASMKSMMCVSDWYTPLLKTCQVIFKLARQVGATALHSGGHTVGLFFSLFFFWGGGLEDSERVQGAAAVLHLAVFTLLCFAFPCFAFTSALLPGFACGLVVGGLAGWLLPATASSLTSLRAERLAYCLSSGFVFTLG